MLVGGFIGDYQMVSERGKGGGGGVLDGETR